VAVGGGHFPVGPGQLEFRRRGDHWEGIP
jgi:hypothetical protein